MNGPQVVTIVQARRGSSRLPDKVLAPVVGLPLLAHQLARVQAARLVGTVVVATTTDPHDNAIAALCGDLHVPCFRGHATDLLDRHVKTARDHAADIVVKIPSDCPLIDPAAIDTVLGDLLEDPARADYVSNLHPPTWPDGNDVEVMPLAVLETAWREAQRGLEREHTTPFLWEQPERFRLRNVAWPSGRDLSRSHRFTIDYPEDLAFVRAVYSELWFADPFFDLDAILDLLERVPEIRQLNACYAGVNWYRHHLAELRTVDASWTCDPDGMSVVKEAP